MKYIGIDIGGTNLKAGLVDETGLLLATRKMKVAGISDPAALAWTFHALSVDLCKDFGCELTDIFSIGVGCPGAVEIRGGSILYTCKLPLRNVPLRRLFHQLSDLPLYIENDANCAALAEYYVGGGRGSKRFITVTLGTGVGGGIIHIGKIFHGSTGMAGGARPPRRGRSTPTAFWRGSSPKTTIMCPANRPLSPPVRAVRWGRRSATGISATLLPES